MNKKLFYEKVRAAFGPLAQSQVEGFEILINEGIKRNASNFAIACVLGETWHETARTMQPITEYGSRSYLRSKKYWPYVGRGYIQLTWKTNYEKYGIADKPEEALKPSVAAYIAWDGMTKGIFTGKKISDYESKMDFRNSRRIINGLDKADTIASYKKVFYEALEASGEASVPSATPVPKTPRTGSRGLQLTLGGILIAIAAAILKGLGVI